MHRPPTRPWINLLCLITVVAHPAPVRGGSGVDAAHIAAVARARELATLKYEPPNPGNPKFLQDLSYDDYRRIRFRDDRAIWRENGLRFRLQWHHIGSLFQVPVTIHLVDGEHRETVGYDQTTFDFGGLTPPELPATIGVAGIRVLSPLNRPDLYDEVVTFLGASYFRAVGAGQEYGLSARGLALDTAAESGEEFPRFSEFWIERPAPDAVRIALVALLDSPRVTGAYRFTIEPGTETEITVEAVLMFRGEVAKVGLAPLASMFHFGENRTRWIPDFRPEVHDSDGLLYADPDGVTWRPLENPATVHRVTRFETRSLWGFGLMQRDRDPQHYVDLESRYHRRPSFWIVPEHGFGAGAVELVEIPSGREWNDNIVAYFVPQRPFGPGDSLEFGYRLRTIGGRGPFPGLARVRSTRIDPGDGKAPIRFVVDFESGAATGAANEAAVPHTAHGRGEVSDLRIEPLPTRDGWRVTFLLAPEGPGEHPLELRLLGGADGAERKTVSERWTYVWSQS